MKINNKHNLLKHNSHNLVLIRKQETFPWWSCELWVFFISLVWLHCCQLPKTTFELFRPWVGQNLLCYFSLYSEEGFQSYVASIIVFCCFNKSLSPRKEIWGPSSQVLCFDSRVNTILAKLTSVSHDICRYMARYSVSILGLAPE